MARSVHRVQHNEEQYVARMNLRYEKLLRQQIGSLEREKEMRTRGLNAERKPYEDKLESFTNRVKQVEQATKSQSRPTRPGLAREKTIDRKLKDLRQSNRFTTGVGYSYIEQLFGNFSKPLTSRPIRWGINVSTTHLHVSSAPPALPTDLRPVAGLSRAFGTRVQGKRVHLRPRHTGKGNKLKPLTLPEVVESDSRRAPDKPASKQTTELLSKADELHPAKDSESDDVLQKISSLQSTEREPLNENRETLKLLPIPEVDESRHTRIEDKEKEVVLEGKDGGAVLVGVVPTEAGDKAENSAEKQREEKPDCLSDSRTGCFVTEFEFPSYGLLASSRSTEVLDLAKSIDSSTTRKTKDSNQTSFKYQLHVRRSSL